MEKEVFFNYGEHEFHSKVKQLSPTSYTVVTSQKIEGEWRERFGDTIHLTVRGIEVENLEDFYSHPNDDLIALALVRAGVVAPGNIYNDLLKPTLTLEPFEPAE